MKSRSFRPRTLAAAVAALVAASGLSADRSFAGSPVYVDDSGKITPNAVGISSTQVTARYIVRFVEQPLALYNSVVASKPINGISSIPLKTMPNGRSRLDVHSTQAKNYVNYLKQQQTQHLGDIAAALGHSPSVNLTMQSALNAAVIVMSSQDAAKVAKLPGVVAVERDFPHPLATDIGPGFIGAASVWWGTPAGQDTIFASGFENAGGFRGDGMVVGDIDTGYNSSSPSFQATDAGGYTIQNPLGTGNFIGQCNVPGISTAGCNDKVIGVYDEINLTGGGPPYSVEDTQGHGSHTASTAAGNQRSATLSGYTAPISGVAPHANLVIYYACSPDVNVQCTTAATSASVDQAIQDGVVDALNYSISGGTSPWNDSTSLAFLSAADAGIFVAAAAGNTSASVPNQVPGTVNHMEPWVATIAAGTHTGGSIAPTLTVTGPGSPPANVQNMPLTAGAGGVSATSTFNGPIVLSPQFSNQVTTGTDGCTGYPAGTFAGATALVSRGTCTFTVKVNAATAAGAVAVVISDNRVEAPLTPSVPGTTVPAYAVLQSQGTNLQTFLAANSNTGTAVIPYPPSRLPTQPDVLANFSLLGPATIDVIKPDLQAPGVNILAAVSGDGTAADADLVALFNGTSMATPHTTGSGVLMMGVNPAWTPAEAKSALMMTAKEVGLTKANGTTPSDYFDRGSGRLQDYIASKAGLVLNETGLNYINADPGFGGDPSTLNIASFDSAKCINACGFTRKFHSTQDHTVTWTATVAPGSDPGVVVVVSPSSFPATANHDTAPISFNVDSSALASTGVFHFAEIVLTPSDASLTPLHLPMAIAVPPPTIAAAPNPVNLALGANPSASAPLTVSNIGGPTLNVSQTVTGNVPFVWSNQVSGDNFGFGAVKYTGLGAGDSDFFAADDFTITGNAPVNLTKIFTPGFVSNNTLTSFGAAMPVHWRIYSDAGGKPSSDPDTAGPAVWSYDATAGSPGVVVTGKFGGDISLNLVTAGQNTALPAGHYWLVVYPTLPCNDGGGGCTEEWFWLNSNTGSGSAPVVTAPQAGQPWTPSDPAAGGGFAMHLESSASCVPPSWLSQTGLPTAIAGNDFATVTVTASAPLHAPAVSAYLCLGSNDPKTPILPVQVNASGNFVPAAPSVSKAFSPTSVVTGNSSTATITLSNVNLAPATLTANLVDTLPANLVATAASAATTCTGGAGASIAAGGGSVTLGTGAVIPGAGSCTLSFAVTSATAATYTNTIAAGSLQTDAGNNSAPASANLGVTAMVVEGFNDITTLAGKGWILANHSNPLGATSWSQGPDVAGGGPFDAQAGATTSFISANFNNTGNTGTISNWMLTPPITFDAATSLSFYTRAAGSFADRLEVRLCTTGACTNFGTTQSDFGDFTTVLKSINPTLTTNDDPTGANGYPIAAWAQFTVNNAGGIPVTGSGRIAFRYFVTNAGNSGANSNFIGIDSVIISAALVGSNPASVNGGNGITSTNSVNSSGARH
jgi:hypothetical protein